MVLPYKGVIWGGCGFGFVHEFCLLDGSNQDIVGFKKVEEFFSFAVQSCKILKSVVDVAVGSARGGGLDGGGVRGGGLSGGGAWGGALGEGCLGGGRGRREIEL